MYEVEEYTRSDEPEVKHWDSAQYICNFSTASEDTPDFSRAEKKETASSAQFVIQS